MQNSHNDKAAALRKMI